jgi:hypothetical protein
MKGNLRIRVIITFFVIEVLVRIAFFVATFSTLSRLADKRRFRVRAALA